MPPGDLPAPCGNSQFTKLNPHVLCGVSHHVVILLQPEQEQLAADPSLHPQPGTVISSIIFLYEQIIAEASVHCWPFKNLSV